MNSQEIRSSHLSDLRAPWRTVRRVEHLYPEFPDAPADEWREGIKTVAERIKAMTDAEILSLGGSWMALRNLVASQMGIENSNNLGCSYGHRVLYINWE